MAAKRSGGGKRRGSNSNKKGSKKGRGNKSVSYNFHIEVKHVLGGVSLLSLLAAFEVFSIPAANGIINLFGFTKGLAGWTWIGVAMLSGGIAVVLHKEEENDKYRNGIR